MKLEVIGTLYTLTKDVLMEICNVLDIKGLRQIDISDKGHSFLIAPNMKHLDSDELTELEDEGMVELLMQRDNIGEWQESVQTSIPEDAGSDVAQTA